MEKSLIDDLGQLGLSTYEAKVYLALLERNSLGTAEVAKLSGVPRARTYDILDSLVSRGLASFKPGKLKKFSALDIETFTEKLIDNTHKEYTKKENQIKTISTALKRKLEALYPPGSSTSDPLEYIEILKDPFQVHRRFMQLFQKAATEVLVFVKLPYSGKEQIEKQVGQQSELLRKGLRIRGIYEIPADEEDRIWHFRMIDAAVKRGESARVMKELPLKMSIFDESVVLFALEDPVSRKPSLTSLVVEHRSLARALKIVFETLWDQAQDYHVLQGRVLQE